MNKKMIILVASLFFLLASIAYELYTKQEYLKIKEELKQESYEIKNIIALKKLWSTKKLRDKIDKILAEIPNKKVKFKRKSFELVAQNLSYRELNFALNKFASIPLQFKKLNIKKVGENFNLECLCEW